MYVRIARKVELHPEVIEGGVQALAYLFFEASKMKVRGNDFRESLLVLAFPDDLNDLLLHVYMSIRRDVRQLLSEMNYDLPHYKDLSWRLDVQVASRMSRGEANPIFLLNIKTQEGPNEVVQTLQTDYTNLKNVTDKLQEALDQVKQPYVRRIARNI
eukprot:TRINITY_DN928_c1_g1_i1.p1 TRINITY_DN928_c1_g1~~TRINITY_DN928_c1_g1_i1.p1  ORF type:complete len:157 (-),score=29.20 TRINITY_DN928_c1_g1_i1:114-584(-)